MTMNLGTLSPAEYANLLAAGMDPETYTAFPAEGFIAGVAGATVPGVGDCVVINVQVLIPLKQLAAGKSRLLQANGQMPSPITGVANKVTTRLLLPKKVLQSDVLALLESPLLGVGDGEDEGSNSSHYSTEN